MSSQQSKPEILTVRPTKPSLRINPNGKPISGPLEGTSSTPLKDLILTPHPNHYIKEGDVTFVVRTHMATACRDLKLTRKTTG